MIKAPQGKQQKQYAPQPNMEPGTYPGRVAQVIDFGLQPQRPYKGQEKPPAHIVGITYELVDCFLVDEQGKELEDKPRWISEDFPLYAITNEKARSTQRYLALDPTNQFDGDFSQVVDRPVNVLVVNNKGKDGRVYDNVGSISPMRPRDAANCAPLKNPPVVFSLDEPNLEVFNKFPKWIQEKIVGNLNYKGSKLDKLRGNVPQEPAKQEQPGPNPFVEDDDQDRPY